MGELETIELPCKVGQILYREDGLWQCQGFDCDENETWRVKLRRETDGGYYYTRMVFGSFGKKIFVSRESYENAFPAKPLDEKLKDTVERMKSESKLHNDWLLR